MSSLLQQLTREHQACIEPIEYLRHAGYNRTKPIAAASDLEGLFSGTTECIQLTPGRLHGEMTSLAVGAIKSFEFSVNRGLQLRAEVPKTRLLIGFTTVSNDTSLIERGRRYTSGAFIVVSGCDIFLSALGPTTMRWLDVDIELLAQRFKDDLAAPPQAVNALVKPSIRHGRLVRNFANRALDLAGYSQSSVSEGISWEMEREAANAIVSIAYCAQLNTETRAERKHLELVQRVEDFMWANIEEPRTLKQICSAAQCKVRTLIYVFKSTFGLSPMKYFKIRRLNAARRKLSASEDPMRICSVAADCGFWHMGHFGADYKALFGFTPKDTALHANAPARERNDGLGFTGVELFV